MRSPHPSARPAPAILGLAASALAFACESPPAPQAPLDRSPPTTATRLTLGGPLSFVPGAPERRSIPGATASAAPPPAVGTPISREGPTRELGAELGRLGAGAGTTLARADLGVAETEPPALDRLGVSFAQGSLASAGVTSAGRASFVAPVIDDSWGGFPVGTGDFAVDVAGASYAAPSAEAVAYLAFDDLGAEYLVLSAYSTETTSAGATVGSVVHVVLPKADAVPGAKIALDGAERYAIFLRGDVDSDRIDVGAVAIEGSVQLISCGLLPGDTVSADLDAQFFEYDFNSPGTTQSSTGAATLPPGQYFLTQDPSTLDVYCDGSLAGQEATFFGTSFGLVDGSVEFVDLGGGYYEIGGAPIQAGLGASPLSLEPYDAATVIGATFDVTPGPAGTDRLGHFLYLADPGAPGWLLGGYGTWFGTPSQDGLCWVQLAFSLEL